MMIVVVLAAVAGVGGVVGIAWSCLATTPGRTEGARLPPVVAGPRPARLLVAAAAGLLGGLVTGWPVGSVLVAAAALGVPALWSQTTAQQAIDHHEAVATWTEMLRDTLHASIGLSQAITATASVAPVTIRPAVRLLSDRLSAGVPMEQALRSLADEVADPTMDTVICALLLAASARAHRLADLLGALAAATRDDVAMRLRVEAVRTSARSSVRIVALFTVGFVAALALLAHAYLAPFGSLEGQAVLAVIGLCDATGLWLLGRMTRPRPAPRLLLASSEVGS